ncbi:PREDICTED: LOW QUALITY PROTEIN: protein LCHN-like [Hipposideros armiger]|uniref:DENN domain-containing protein 11 n=1 Tax=Hipposideros armiger TaxID=186990 RepID=A0A8B7QB25_HIPAR|nr:PREDICTED: LOW QUALITY PROTEIN: protein LCHN-like [Hipposideros armiger]
MVERGAAVPLLSWAEDPAVSPPQAPELQAGGWGWGGTGGGRLAAEPWRRREPEGLGASEVLLQPGRLELGDMEEDQMVAVFVVTFDPRSGNMVEWCLPQDIDLEDVAFKSMASGSHKIQSDFIYFRKGPFFGLACFANMPVESELELGARMKSVGILSPSHTPLYRYMHFLENQVRHQLEMPGQHSHLAAFYEDKKGVLRAGPGRGGSPPPVCWLPSIHRYMYPEMKITHPAGCMSQFIKFFGDQILVLWKFALLQKRILIFSPPPVGVVCYRVHCCCCPASVSLPSIGGAIPESKPFFYVHVADIESLEVEVSYVACTTEKIFEEKRELYDEYVDNKNVKTHHDHLQPLLKINSADREKYRRLKEQRQMLQYSQEVEGDSDPCEEDLFVLFILKQNNRIFQTLLEVSASQDKTLTAEHARHVMGLDPQGDRSFLLDLLEAYVIDVMLSIDNPCCP